jgi:hypothetical protein
VLQRHSIQKLHDDEGAVIFLPDFVNGTDIGVVQSRGGLGLALESGQGLRVFGYLVGQKLHRDKPVEG